MPVVGLSFGHSKCLALISHVWNTVGDLRPTKFMGTQDRRIKYEAGVLCNLKPAMLAKKKKLLEKLFELERSSPQFLWYV